MAWTPEQDEAIKKEGTNIIVSAGAGSGKTAVLTERVKRKLLNGVHVNELLVLTFTNAAAAEMKDRIRDAINEEESLKEESNLIDGAYITTFDSFSLSMVKKYHTKLNITNNIKISDEVIIDMKKHEIIDNLFNEYYESNNSMFNSLITDFCLKDDKELKDYILNVYKKIELKYDKDYYLNNFFDIEMTNNKINSFIDEYINLIKRKQQSIINLLPNLNEYFDGDFIVKIEDSIKDIINAENYEDFIRGLDIKSPTVPRGTPEEGKQIKSKIYEIVKEIKELCIYESTNEMKEELLSTLNNQKIIIEILIKLNNILDKWKLENEIFNFTDIARLAIILVSENEDIKNELKYSFNEILVDEYQDTSDTQETFINLISNNNVYMVGDIKQSIYRFRNANPYIFKNKYDLYRDTDKGIKIDLLKNFRSREEVLNNINTIFDLIMDDTLGGADYKASHRMVFGNISYNEEGKTNENYNMDLITYSDLEGITKDEEEAFIIGNDIKNKINNKYQVFDKKKKILRAITYSDFVILLDKSKNFELYKKIFEYLQIPLSILKEESLRKDDDVLVLKNILKLIIKIKNKEYDNDFKYNYLSISRSFLYKKSDDELYNIIKNNSFYDTDLFIKCLNLTKHIDYINASSFFRLVLDEFDYDKKLLTIGNIKSFKIRCEYFYNLIKNYEENGKTIYDFISYIDEIFNNDYDLKFNINESSSNSCKIMTIHKSKGLEFPICYFAGLSSKFNMAELKEKIIYDNKLGLILPKIDNYYKDTILKTILKDNTKYEEISEKIRLLYVAVTRAKEKMIFVLPEQEVNEIYDFVPTYIREKYNSFLSIIKSIYPNIEEYIIKSDVVGTKDYLIDTKTSNDNLTLDNDLLNVKEISINNELIEDKHYSKSNLHIITKEEKELLEFGTKIHEILELSNFKELNINDNSFISNKIKSFINSDLIKDKLDYNMYKEYEFYYEDENTNFHGIIDLLIDCIDYFMIIDYKLKNISDDEYNKQLNGYREYIEKITGKKVKCYLYSILDEVYKEVI